MPDTVIEFDTIENALRACVNNVRIHGWGVASVNSDLADPGSFELAVRSIGVPYSARTVKEGIEVLSPTTVSMAMPASLSSAYGIGEFPLHTDAAHWPIPPRLMLMLCVCDEQNRSTQLLPWDIVVSRLSASGRSAIMRASYLVRNGRRSHYCAMNLGSAALIRLDSNCMTPATSDAVSLAAELEDTIPRLPRHSVRWSAGMVLVVDNWRVLHGRDGGSGAGQRILVRALLKDG